MNRRDLSVFLGLQVLAIAIAGGSFMLIESRLIAGFVAGAYFLGSGLYMLWRVSRWPDKWRSLVLYPLALHVFAISIPMLVTRALTTGVEFTDVRILGLPGPEFHKLSTRIFMVMMAATVFDWVRAWRAERAARGGI